MALPLPRFSEREFHFQPGRREAGALAQHGADVGNPRPRVRRVVGREESSVADIAAADRGPDWCAPLETEAGDRWIAFGSCAIYFF